MSEAQPPAPESTPYESALVESLFVRHRNVLLTRADLSPLMRALDEHRAANSIEVAPEHDGLFRQALAAFVMHCAARPRNEHLSWTINFQQPLVNLFFVGDTGASSLCGRVFSENVKQSPEQNFYQEFVPPGKDVIRSHVTFDGCDAFIAAETYYDKSEQRPARFFQLSETQFVILSAHPDWQEDWFHAQTVETVRALDQTETLSHIEYRRYRWGCGCSEAKLLSIIAPMMRDSGIDSLYEGDPEITANCPRCAARYTIARDLAEAAVAKLAEGAASRPSEDATE